MYDLDQFTSIVVDESIDQGREIIRLSNWVELASRLEPHDLLFPGIAKLVELDLLRYGSLPGDFKAQRGFGVVRQSAAALTYINREVLPTDLNMAAVLIMICNATIMMETAGTIGEPEFVFWTAAETATFKPPDPCGEMSDKAIH